MPGVHTLAAALVDPAAHAYPVVHRPLHTGDARALELPKVPAGHSEHVLVPPALNLPGPHAVAVALVEPAPHTYPAAHGPEHWAVTWPVTFPYRPGLHAPLQLDDVRLVVLPNTPAGHAEQTPAPATL